MFINATAAESLKQHRYISPPPNLTGTAAVPDCDSNAAGDSVRSTRPGTLKVTQPAGP